VLSSTFPPSSCFAPFISALRAKRSRFFLSFSFSANSDAPLEIDPFSKLVFFSSLVLPAFFLFLSSPIPPFQIELPRSAFFCFHALFNLSGCFWLGRCRRRPFGFASASPAFLIPIFSGRERDGPFERRPPIVPSSVLSCLAPCFVGSRFFFLNRRSQLSLDECVPF